MMIPPDGVKRKLNGVVDSVPPDKCCEVLNGGVNDEEWDKSDNRNVADSDDGHILIKWGAIIKCYEGQKFQMCNTTPLQLSIKEYLGTLAPMTTKGLGGQWGRMIYLCTNSTGSPILCRYDGTKASAETTNDSYS